MDSRRKFIGAMATGLASTLASSAGVLGANDRMRIGIIGAGQRGTELVHQALACPNVEIANSQTRTRSAWTTRATWFLARPPIATIGGFWMIKVSMP